jgi:hypothetical protein
MLAAAGTLAALLRRSREGGSWHVRVSLCRTAAWIHGHGSDALRPAQRESIEEVLAGGRVPGLRADEVAALCRETQSGYGRIGHLAPVVELSETPPRWARPSSPPGTHPAAWPAPDPPAGP